MKENIYRYKQYRWYIESIVCLALSCLTGAAVMPSLPSVGLAIIWTGGLVTAVLHWAGGRRNAFFFVPNAVGLHIEYRKQDLNIPWETVQSVREDHNGLYIVCNGLTLPIMRDMVGYDTFRTLLFARAAR